MEEEITLLNGKKSGHRRTDPQSYAESVQNNGKYFKWTKCDSVLETQGLLDAHTKTHSIFVHSCDSCTKVFKNTSDLEVHFNLEHKHSKLEEWNCNDCPFQANAPSELMKHLKTTTHQPSPNVSDRKRLFNDYKRCYTCNLEVDGYWNLMNHRKEVHPSNKKCTKVADGKCHFGSKSVGMFMKKI